MEMKVQTMDDNTRITELESKHMICILMFLRRNGPSSKTVVYEGVSKNPRMPEKLKGLVKLGLVTIDDSTSPSRVELTSVGKEVADHLIAVRELLNGSVE